ncbi:75189e6e-0020-4674-86e1-cd438e05a49d [Thermothielavioides terrestris]|uniref:75189e6e-0020-4674-86e1-cd438e05a49d n=1 Tax=Thermothielavioides terrestris TaxID=2587410 RepID=A0A446BMD1_9PEZI|nr:75189e6e-0020-4674-86e1-cd438e05a49d [Thermothielavioides terrestris]
MSYSPLSSL